MNEKLYYSAADIAVMLDKQNGKLNITCKKCGDYLMLNLLPDLKPEGQLREFGLIRKSYLEKHGDLFGFTVIGQIKRAFIYDTGSGKGIVGFAGGTDGKEKESDKTAKETGSDALGVENK